MRSNRLILTTLFTLLFGFGSPGHAAIDDNAAVVTVRTSCTENGVTMDNCFTTLNALNTWVYNTRQPDPDNRLEIDIGPGTFQGPLNCFGGYMTVRGAGASNTLITDRIVMSNCDQFEVLDLKVHGGYGGVEWSGTGSTKWTNVEIYGAGYGWYESGGTCDHSKTQHYWFSSRIISEPLFSLNIGYDSRCGEAWFFGSEVISRGVNTLNLSPFSSNGWGSHYPLISWPNTEIHVYGSVLRSLLPSGSTAMNNNHGKIALAQGGEIHIHGTGIDVINDTTIPVDVLVANNGGMIHANETAYNIHNSAGATATRIVNNSGSISAPFQWKQNTTPPDILSVTGADMAVETDCASSGCQTSGTETHLLIYNSNCTGNGPWFDVVTGACR